MTELVKNSRGFRLSASMVGGLAKRVQWLLSRKHGRTPLACSKPWTCSTGIMGLCLVAVLVGCSPEARRGKLEPVDDPVAGCIWSLTTNLPGVGAKISDCDVRKVAGRVMFDDQPVASAEVWAVSRGRIGGREQVLTDGEGRFELLLPIDPRMATRSWKIAAFHADRFGDGGEADGNSDVLVQLRDGRSVDVDVRDRTTDARIVGARLFLDDGRIVDGGGDSLIHLIGLRRNIVELVVAAPGYARRRIQADLHSLTFKRLTVKMEKGGQIQGRVVDKNQQPVGSNPVGLMCGHTILQAGLRTFTNADGRYAYQGVSLNQPTRINTYSHRIPGGSEWEDHTITLSDDKPLQVNFSVHGDHSPPALGKSPRILHSLAGDNRKPERGAVRGRVLLPDGQPASEFELSFGIPRDWKPGEKSGGASPSLFTDPDGRFEFTGLKKDLVYRVIAASAGYQDAIIGRTTAVGLDDLATSEPLRLQLKQPVSLNVTVTRRETQAPIGEADVWLVPNDPKHAMNSDKNVRRRIHGATDSSGRTQFDGVPFPDGVLVVEKAGLGTERVAWDGSPTVTASLSKSASLTVQIKRPGVWPKSLTVYLQRDGSNRMAAQDAGSGDTSVVFENVTAAGYKLSIDGDDYKLDNDSWEKSIGQIRSGSNSVHLQLKVK